MEIKVKSLYLSISPRKMRPVLFGLRGKNAEEALNYLLFVNKKGAKIAADLIKSGIAAAKENYLEPKEVLVKSIFCNEGPRLKRIQPWSKGQARRIVKKRSHLVLALESTEEVKPSQSKAKLKEQKPNDQAAKDKE